MFNYLQLCPNKFFRQILPGVLVLLIASTGGFSVAQAGENTTNIDSIIVGAIDPSIPTGEARGSRAFRSALSLINAQKYAEAYAQARGFANALERRTIQWAAIYFGKGEIDYNSVLRFAADAPKFASARLYKTRIEQALAKANAGKDVVIARLGGKMPITIDGQIILAKAYIADGQRARAARIARQIWTSNFLKPEQEAITLKAFSPLLRREDHWKRAVYLLMNNQARSAQRILSFLSPAQKSLALARIAVSRGQSNAASLLERVDPAYRDHPLFQFSRAQLARRNGNLAGALMFLERAKADLPSPSLWWYERRTLARKFLVAGDPKNAYRTVTGYKNGPEGRMVDAYFHAGWIALSFLNDPKSAAVNFEKMRAISTLADTIAQSNYWLGRTYSALGDQQKANQAFTRAAEHHMSYYGQLARYRLGLTDVEMRALPAWQNSVPGFDALPLVRAVRLLAANGKPKMAEPLVSRLVYQVTDAGEMLLTARLAQSINAHQLAILMADVANRKDVALDLFNYPRDGIPSGVRLAKVDRAAIYAIARQESRFDVDAVSYSGALGVMQLMPATAEETAGMLKIGYSAQRLTTDVAYNALLGSTYLGRQLARFNGSLVLAAAAYNAGGGNVNKWIASFGNPSDANVDPVVWIELIPFVQTRKYVQRVVANYMFYRARFGGSEPNIARVLRRIDNAG